jgi:hypothetical protein
VNLTAGVSPTLCDDEILYGMKVFVSVSLPLPFVPYVRPTMHTTLHLGQKKILQPFGRRFKPLSRYCWALRDPRFLQHNIGPMALPASTKLVGSGDHSPDKTQAVGSHHQGRIRRRHRSSAQL